MKSSTGLLYEPPARQLETPSTSHQIKQRRRFPCQLALESGPSNGYLIPLDSLLLFSPVPKQDPVHHFISFSSPHNSWSNFTDQNFGLPLLLDGHDWILHLSLILAWDSEPLELNNVIELSNRCYMGSRSPLQEISFIGHSVLKMTPPSSCPSRSVQRWKGQKSF